EAVPRLPETARIYRGLFDLHGHLAPSSFLSAPRSFKPAGNQIAESLPRWQASFHTGRVHGIACPSTTVTAGTGRERGSHDDLLHLEFTKLLEDNCCGRS